MKRTRREVGEGGEDGLRVNVPSDADKGDAASPDEGPASAAEGGRLFYAQKIAELSEEKTSIEDGTHQAIVTGQKELAVERDRQLKEAALNRELRIKEIEALYAYDCKAAKESYINALNDVKENVLGDVNETIKRMEDLRDGVLDGGFEGVRSSKRTTRSKRMDGDEDMENDAAPESSEATNARNESGSKSPTLAGFSQEQLSGLNFFMREQSVSKDLAEIQQDWRARAEKFLSEEQIADESVKVMDGALYYNEHIFEKEADVIVTTEVTKEELFGEIQSINTSDVTVKLLDGTQTRVLLTHLRSGRCNIAPVDED